MESKPKFEINETVILVCDIFPEDNGEYEVEEREFSNDFEYFNAPERIQEPPQWWYKLSNSEYWYGEEELRKKHQGSEFGFTELLEALNNPVQLPQHIEN